MPPGENGATRLFADRRLEVVFVLASVSRLLSSYNSRPHGHQDRLAEWGIVRSSDRQRSDSLLRKRASSLAVLRLLPFYAPRLSD